MPLKTPFYGLLASQLHMVSIAIALALAYRDTCEPDPQPEPEAAATPIAAPERPLLLRIGAGTGRSGAAPLH